MTLEERLLTIMEAHDMNGHPSFNLDELVEFIEKEKQDTNLESFIQFDQQ